MSNDRLLRGDTINRMQAIKKLLAQRDMTVMELAAAPHEKEPTITRAVAILKSEWAVYVIGYGPHAAGILRLGRGEDAIGPRSRCMSSRLEIPKVQAVMPVRADPLALPREFFNLSPA